MPEGTVTHRKVSKKGAPVIVIDGKDYYAGRCEVGNINIGDKISFDSAEFAPGLYGLQSWKLLASAQKYPTAQQYPASVSPTVTGVTGHVGFTEGERLTISNWVGQAIAAGAIKEPEQIEKWVSAAKNAIRKQSD
jgi:hypothetical protein